MVEDEIMTVCSQKGNDGCFCCINKLVYGKVFVVRSRDVVLCNLEMCVNSSTYSDTVLKK